ncbi:cytochrome P450 [Wolfiporia cocos MD-104 SS10]|uniref:Cytochrome P450 n=1 Tax=Wolfiporia cocos (strain MD-104) TaxID=742152 RepID=A0A2H3JNV5_WOLCO|nr:cytochrome P450 [Wolfiporia cocos MD-104 SS10]
MQSWLVLHNGWVVHRGFKRSTATGDGNPIPPGPLFRFPFLPKYPERILHRWTKQYGSIYSVWMGNQLFVVMNDPEVARDLLVIHGANFSSRWSYFMKNQTILQGGAITATPYNETWRKHRRIANTILAPKAIKRYHSTLQYEAHMLVRSLYYGTQNGTIPVNPARYAGRYVLNNMLSVTFATRIGSVTDPLIKKTLSLGDEFMMLTGPWSNAIDFIKPLQWMPTRIRSRGRKLHQDFLDVYGAMILLVKKRMESGEDAPDCLVKSLLKSQEEEELSWTDICMLATAFATGGSHSTSGTIQWFLAFMPSHPEIQAKAHEELDCMVGRDRLPTLNDEMRLPYVRAIIKEVLRCRAPFWMATPHCSDNDFVYKGMYIPVNTVMILNCYSLHHNEERYPEPFTFNPDRFADDNLSSTESSKLSNAMERDHWAFGAGRRICPGMPIAENEIFLAVSRLLWAFSIQIVPGKPPCLEEYEGNSGRTPLPFKVMLVPRHENVEAILTTNGEIPDLRV